MKIHAIRTGMVAIKSRQRVGVGHGSRRLLNALLDRKWTEPLPIYAFAIEHPEGVIVVDTGETARALEPGYFPRWHPYYRFGIKEWVTPEEEIGPQLNRLGISASDVRLVVLTHLHTDHAGGLQHFPHNEILASRADLETAAGFVGRLRGYLNNRFPSWFEPTAVDLSPMTFGPFPRSQAITKDGDVVLIPIPGHTPGQIGVVVMDGDRRVFLAGDASYSQELMVTESVDGVSANEAVARATLKLIHRFVTEEPTVYAVAHDPETASRLGDRRVVDN
jgi:N-acyl homoserine lactone hydrolase